MPYNPSNAGPYTIGLEQDLGPDESITLNMEDIRVGPRNQKGYLKHFFGDKGGMDYIYVQNGSQYKIHVELATGNDTTVQSATSSNIEGPARNVTIWHEESSTTISSSDIDISVGNDVRSQDENNSGFNPLNLLGMM